MSDKDDEKPRWMVTRRTVEEVFADGTPMHFINATTLSLEGHPVEIGEPPADAVLICAYPHQLPPSDLNALAGCDECGTPIIHRKTAPPHVKRVCYGCAKRRGAFNI